MKTKILSAKSNNFEPITVEITFESMGEVINFYARANAAHVNVERSVPSGEDMSSGGTFKLFELAKEVYKVAKKQMR